MKLIGIVCISVRHFSVSVLNAHTIVIKKFWQYWYLPPRCMHLLANLEMKLLFQF